MANIFVRFFFFIDEHKTRTCTKKGIRTLIYYPDFWITNIQKERKKEKKKETVYTSNHPYTYFDINLTCIIVYTQTYFFLLSEMPNNHQKMIPSKRIFDRLK
jgi:hypothetical protein